MNILVTGSKGQLGSEINALSPDYKNFNFFFTDVDELDITNKQAIQEYVVGYHIEAIVNCAAYTAVDKAESEPELADLINHVAVRYLAEVCKEQNVKLIHISTDYVFDGKGYRPYPTDHPTHPVNKYGETKLNGELVFKEINPSNSIIIRTSWVYSSFGNNFVKTMLRLGEEQEELNIIADQVGVPTYAFDLAGFILDKAIHHINDEVVTYHYTNEGVCSWYDFAQEIMKLGHRKCRLNPIPTSAYPTPAKRPYYSIMDKSNLSEEFELKIPYWKDSLINCIQQMVGLKPIENQNT